MQLVFSLQVQEVQTKFLIMCALIPGVGAL